MIKNSKGWTLVELLVVMAIFVTVIAITGDVFKTLLKHSTKLMKSEESNIEGVIGLEMFRHDIQQAGFGLPWDYLSPPITYTEATTGGSTIAGRLNDAPSGVPRAVAGANNIPDGLSDPTSYAGTGAFRLIPNTDYLSIKATTVGTNNAAQRWTYVNYSSAATGSKPPKTWPIGNLSAGDRVIVVNRRFVDGVYSNTLAYDTGSASTYWVNFSNSGLVSAFSPASPEEIFFLYGITGSGSLGMPFNRADFFVGTPATISRIPAVCAGELDSSGNRAVGILYKATVNHSNGQLNYMPILDCVADLQVIYGWNFIDSTGVVSTDPVVRGSGNVDTWSTGLNADGSGPSVVSGAASVTQVHTAFLDPAMVRSRLKMIKVYALAQNGRRDRDYTYVNNNPVNGEGTTEIFVGPSAAEHPGSQTLGHIYNLKPTGGADLTHYRWKVYRLILTPKNLLANQ